MFDFKEWIDGRSRAKRAERDARLYRSLQREAERHVQLCENAGKVFLTVDGLPLLNGEDLHAGGDDTGRLLQMVALMRRRYVAARAEALRRHGD